MSNYSTNLTDVYELARDETLAKILIGVQVIILFLAIFGNSTVLLVIFLQKKVLSRMTLLIIHLCLADLFVAFFNVLPQMLWDITYRFYGNNALCKFVKYFQVVAMYASSYVLIATAIDRHVAICKPLDSKTMTRKRVHVLVFVAWIMSLVFATPQIFIFGMREIKPNSTVYDCWADFNPPWTLQAYITSFTVVVYIIPFFILLILYGQICIVVWQSGHVHNSKFISNSNTNRQLQAQGCNNHANSKDPKPKIKFRALDSRHFSPRAHTGTLPKSKIKTVKMTLTVILCYVLCWGPFFVAQMWSVWDKKAPFNSRLMNIVLRLASLNSCTNPWIFLAFNNQVSSCCHANDKVPKNGNEQSRSILNAAAVSTRLNRYDASLKNDCIVASVPIENINSNEDL